MQETRLEKRVQKAFLEPMVAKQFIRFRRQFGSSEKTEKKAIAKIFGISFGPPKGEGFYEETKILSGGRKKKVYRIKKDKGLPMVSPIKNTDYKGHKVGPDEFSDIACLAFYIANVDTPIANRAITYLKLRSMSRGTVYRWFDEIMKIKKAAGSERSFSKLSYVHRTVDLVNRLFAERKKLVNKETDPGKALDEKLPTGNRLATKR